MQRAAWSPSPHTAAPDHPGAAGGTAADIKRAVRASTARQGILLSGHRAALRIFAGKEIILV